MGRELGTALARNLKEGRGRLCLSQAGLAEKAGVSPGYVGEIESGRKLPTLDILEKLALALDLPAYRLLMRPEDVEAEAGSATRQRAYEAALRVRGHLDEELRELSRPSGEAGAEGGN